MILMPFDTETTGLPDWKNPSEAENQPHIVQLAALLVDESGEIIDSMDVIVKPDGWLIPADTIAIHGISNERAQDEGIPEEDALRQFIGLFLRCDLRVAHNTTFDNRIIRIAMKRYCPDLISDEVWKDKNLYSCTLFAAKKIMGGSRGHTLPEAYQHFTGKTLEGAHNAMVDTKACLEIYQAIQQQQKKVA